MRFSGLILDCDGVLLESEWAGNAQIAEFLSERGFPTTVRQAMDNFMGLAGPEFLVAIERWVGGPIPADFERERRAADERMIRKGICEVEGAVRFVRSLDPGLPKAVASSSSREWVERHLDHLGIRHLFGEFLFSGRTDVARGKPAPDLYWHVAERLCVPIERLAVVEDSPVGVAGAVASGATVIGLVAGRHCGHGHAERLRDLGAHHIASSFDEVSAILA
jgi:beta-phosphoglucomutase-like phosphatase (HAD superfamily)